MKRLFVFIALMMILLVGGGLTTQLLSNSGSLQFPVLTQTVQPDASPTTMLPWKAEQFFLLIGFVIFNLVGIAGTLALIFWFVDRGIRQGKAEKSAEKQVTTEAS
ncbi:MAG: hypothetical protein SF162_05120 [bacterium]|nr:hypothetical protein [bacterium]